MREFPIREFLYCAVNPSKAQGFFYDIKIWKYAYRRVLGAAHHNPAFLRRDMILLQPISQLLTLSEFKKKSDFHIYS